MKLKTSLPASVRHTSLGALVAVSLISGMGWSSTSMAAISKAQLQTGEQNKTAGTVKKSRIAKKATPQEAVGKSGAAVAMASTGMDVALKPSSELSSMPPASRPEPALQHATPASAVPNVAYVPRVNPYLVNVAPRGVQLASAPKSSAYLPGGETRIDVEPALTGMSGLSGLSGLLPSMPLFEQSILPRVKTVYPTGEKPLVVVTFKCPTEIIGIDTPSTVILHKVVNGGMDLVNKTNLLSFNMQQVCQ